jgi:hypothetical protein
LIIGLHHEAPMNEFEPQDKERLENWKALQVALGLVPEETPVPVQPAKANPTPNPLPQTPRADADIQEKSNAAPARPQPTLIEEPSSPFESPSSAPPHESAEAEQEVEVGEAPEEVPEEPSDEQTAPGEKRRRRRRRRRRRGADEATEDGVAKSDRPLEGSDSAPSSAFSANDADDGLQDDGDDEGEDDDDEEIEPLSIPDWNVPTWQELIASLYRPER